MKPEVHDLKCWPAHFDEIRKGRKHVEVRKDDRDFEVGDLLLLREYDDGPDEYTGRHLLARVTHIIREQDHQGITTGFVAMSIYRFREPRSI